MLSYEWTQVSGPGTAEIFSDMLSGGELPTEFMVDVPGTYVLRLTVNDGELIGFDDVTVTLFAEELENSAPLVDAGADQTLQFPTTSVQVFAEISDDGKPSPSMLSYEWTQMSGPGTAVILPDMLLGGELPTEITVDIAGTYVLRLTASDGELSNFDDVTVTLSSAPVGGGPMLSGIRGHWRLDENSGTQAVNSINAAQSGTLLNLDESHWGPGVYNGGLCFDGQSGQQVSIATAAPDLISESISLSGWVRVDNTFNKWVWVAGQGDNYGLFIQDSGTITFYFYHGSGWIGVIDGGWHHVTGTFDDANDVMAVYLDGVQLATNVTDTSMAQRHGAGFSLGSMRGSRNFKGCLDEIQLYGRALSETEVQQLFQP